jgi:AbrB family looped-hinge helix DNA binding protein
MEQDVTVMSVKGQVVIPRGIRRKMKLKPKDRLVVYEEADTIIMKKWDLPKLKEMWKEIGKIAKERNKKYGRMSEEEIQEIIDASRAERRRPIQ